MTTATRTTLRDTVKPGNWRDKDMLWHDKPPNPERWAIIPWCEFLHGSQQLLEVSNYRTLKKELLKFNKGRSEPVLVGEMGHWLAGPIEQMFILCLRKDGSHTKAYEKLLELLDDMDGYPVLDHEHLDKLVEESEMGCIRDILERKNVESHLIEGVAGDVHAWLRQNKEDEVDRCRADDYGHVDEDSVLEYLTTIHIKGKTT